MILEDKTNKKYGYTSKDLDPRSNKMVVWKCDDCGYERDYVYSYYLQNKKAKEEVCQKCCHKHRKGRVVIDIDKDSFCELPPEICVEETLKKFGYDPRDLKPWSRKQVVVRCSVLGSLETTQRSILNRNKSVLDTGHYISKGGHTKLRRLGLKASDDTKQRMSKSQRERRKLELIKTNNLNKEET